MLGVTNVEIKYLRPTVPMMEEIAKNMRQADIDEAWVSHHQTPLQALLESWKISSYSVIITVDDEPCVMIGLVIRDILSGNGVPWMLGTNTALKHKKNFFTEVPNVIKEMLTHCSKLHNYVHCKNKVSIKWLKWIGFTLCDPEPYGCEKELFHKFYLERT